MRKNLLFILSVLVSLSVLAQTPAWVTKMGSSNADLSYFSCAVDSSGNTYVTGTFSGTATFGSFSITSNGLKDNFLAKIDCGGTVAWVEKIGSVNDEGDWGSVTVDKNNNIYVTGSHSNSCTLYSSNASNQTLSSTGGQDLYLAKYTTAGVLTWAINAGGGTGKENSFGVKTDNQNNVIITGYYGYNGVSCTFGGTAYTCAGVYDLFVEKFDAAGTFQWVRTAGSSGDDIGVALEIDTNNNIYVAGQYWNTLAINGTAFTVAHSATAGWDGCVLKYTSAGTYKWGQPFTGNSYDGVNMMAYDNGFLYVSGCYQGAAFTLGSANASTQTIASTGGYDIYGAKYDTLGNLIWVDHWGGNGDDIARSVVVNGSKIVWTGNYNNSFTVGSGTLSSTGASDIFLITTNAAGAALTSQSFGGVLGDEAWCIAKDKNSNLYVSGTFNGTCNFGSKSVSSFGSTDVFVTKLTAQNNTLTFLPNDTSVCAASYTITPTITASYYLWNTGATTQSITVSASGKYKLKTLYLCDTVYDSIFVQLAPTIITNNDTAVCSGTSKTLTTTGTATRFLWNTADTTASITVTPSVTTQYWVRGQIGINNCYTADTVTITVNPIPTITTNNDTTVCSGTTKTLSSSGTATRFVWNTGDTTASITVTPSVTTSYWVRGQIGTAACYAYDTVKITVNPLTTITTNNDTTVCNGTAKTLTASGTATRFVWSTGDTTTSITVTPSVTTSYWVRGQIGTAACYAYDTVTITVVPQPTIATNADTSFCSSTVKILTTTGTTTRYLWSTGDTTPSISVTPLVTTTYWVRGQIGTAACYAYDTVTVTVNPMPAITTSNDTTVCNGTSKTLTAAGTSTRFVWSTGDTTASITVTPSVTTAYWVRGQIGTAACYAYDTVTITVVPQPTIVTNADTSFCSGTGKTLTTTGTATRYLWSTGDTTASITVTPLVTTTYWVRGQIGTAACYAYDTVVITVTNCTVYCITCNNATLIVNNSLQACYPFTGNAVDASGNGNNGTASNATSIIDRSGNPNDAYLFNGSNSEITVPHTAALSYSKSSTFTVGVWVYATASTNFTSVITKSEQSDTSGYVIGFDNTGKFRFISNLLYEVKTTSAIPLNSWQHIVVTYNTNNQVRIYVNGVLNATGTVPNLNANTYDIKFGRLYSITNGWFFNGKIDDIRFYNRTLTAAEINQLYNGTALPVYAGADRTICTGDTTQLNASGGTTYSWTPATGLSNTGIANPKAFPSVTTDYICTITEGTCVSKDTVRVYVGACTTCPLGAASLNPELIVNGDFESGNSGFSSDYLYVNPTVGNQGEYSITKDASLSSIYLSGCRDHTSGAGNFMLIDGNTVSSKRFWYQNVAVKPYTSYVFTFWADNPYNAVPAQIRVTINGSVNSSFIVPNNTCQWQNYGVVWNSGASTNALIELNDMNTAWIGNDFGVDDISFKECGCIPIVSNLSNQTICEGDSIQINATNVNALRYLWTPSTGISNDTVPDPWFKPLNTTTYIVRISNGTCITFDTLDITVNKKPLVNLGNDTFLCTGSSFTLRSPAGVPRVWSTGDTTQNITVLIQADSMNFLPQVFWVRSGTGTCSNTDSINVYGIPRPKVSVLLNGKKVICPGSSVSLGVSNIPVWAGVKWSTGDTTRNISVTPASTTLYTVYYYNSLCGFNDTVTIIVLPKPTIVTSPDPTICEGASTTMTVNGALTYLWSTGAVGSSLKVSPSVTTKYWVIGSSVSCTSDTSWITVTVTPKAKASFTATPPKGPIPLTVVFTNTSTNAGNYRWYFGDGTDSLDEGSGSVITHTYTAHGKYNVKLVAYNATGCNDSMEAIIEAYAPYFIFIPSAFSPDGNTINELFEINYNGIKYLEGTIYNRWGEELYSWKTPGDPWWDGSYRGKKCEEDAYIYFLRVKDLSNNVHIYRGQLYLVR